MKIKFFISAIIFISSIFVFAQENNDSSKKNSMNKLYTALKQYETAINNANKKVSLSPQNKKLLLFSLQQSLLCQQYYLKKEYNQALKACNKVIEIEKKLYKDTHPETASIYTLIGSIYKKMGDYSKALDAYNKALEINKKLFGDSHPDIATIYNDIGKVYQEKGDYEMARYYIYKARNIWRNVFGN